MILDLLCNFFFFFAANDGLIQEVMHGLKGVTRAIIAHRLNSVITCDRILLMDAGQVKESENPAVLVQRETSLFRALVKDTGDNSSRHLIQLALSATARQEDVHEEQEEEYEGMEKDFELMQINV
jgi:ABC-type multidrug transport system ATPase subunit